MKLISRLLFHRNTGVALNIPAYTKKRNFNKKRRFYNPMRHLEGVVSLETLADALEADPEVLSYDMAGIPGKSDKGQLEFVRIIEGGRTHTLFFDRAFVQANLTAERWYIDSTFSPRPKGCGYQLMTIMMQKNHKVRYSTQGQFHGKTVEVSTS